jgi:hypothetical protein
MRPKEPIKRTTQKIPLPLWENIASEAKKMKITPQRYLEKATVIYNG